MDPGEVACCLVDAQGVAPRTAPLETACSAEDRDGNFSLLIWTLVVNPGTAPTFLFAAASAMRAHIAALPVFCDFGTELLGRIAGRMSDSRMVDPCDIGAIGTKEGNRLAS